MYYNTKVMICGVGETERVLRIVLAMSEAAWDAGAALRVRRIGGVDTADESAGDTERPELVRELQEIPPATVEDLEWSDVALFGIALRNGEILLAVERLIETRIAGKHLTPSNALPYSNALLRGKILEDNDAPGDSVR